MNTFSEILNPNFLLRDALVGSVLVGLVCPLVGVYFVLRRMVFLGVALPQVSAAGPPVVPRLRLIAGPHEHGEGAAHAALVAGSLGFTPLALLFWRRSSSPARASSADRHVRDGGATILSPRTQPRRTRQHPKGDIATAAQPLHDDRLGGDGSHFALSRANSAVVGREISPCRFAPA
jgi:hypothetical protein